MSGKRIQLTTLIINDNHDLLQTNSRPNKNSKFHYTPWFLQFSTVCGALYDNIVTTEYYNVLFMLLVDLKKNSDGNSIFLSPHYSKITIL